MAFSYKKLWKLRIDCDMTEQIEGGNEYYEALEALACPSMLMGA